LRNEPKRELATDAHGRTQTVKLRGQKGEKARKLGCWKGEKVGGKGAQRLNQ